MSEADLLAIFQYSIAQGEVYYSSKFKNDTKIMTLNQVPLTMTESANDVFVDAARITTRDYIVSNGVLQIIDR